MPAIRKVIGLALLVAGIVLLVFAYQASHSAASDVSRFVTGNPTDRAMWLMIGGIVCVVVGLGATLLPLKLFRR
ncbi:MAG: DUF3185 family protein [Gammaproteobacteria bacterium]